MFQMEQKMFQMKQKMVANKKCSKRSKKWSRTKKFPNGTKNGCEQKIIQMHLNGAKNYPNETKTVQGNRRCS